MAITLGVAFADFVAKELTEPVFVLTKVLFGLQVLLQLLALYGSVQKVRRQLSKRGARRGMTSLGYFIQVYLNQDIVFLPIIVIAYLFVVCLISILLGLTN